MARTRSNDRRPSAAPPVLEEADWLDRRTLLRALGMGGALVAGGPSLACGIQAGSGVEEDPTTTYPESARWKPGWSPAGGAEAYPAARNPGFGIRRSLTPEDKASAYNNFYEFLPGRAGPVHQNVEGYVPRPWQITVAGAVEEERTIDLDELVRIAPLEERLYHFRCVEAWSMVVPWIGIPMAKFVAWCRPKADARFVRFVSFPEPKRSKEGERKPYEGRHFFAANYPWPYYEGLRMDEATHPLALLATGIYGHGLPMQHGAPVRAIVPWKYGYKSPKSIVRVEFTKEQPGTFWNDLSPSEYGFLSNVEPDVPHPRWSQATERDLATGDRIRTLPYNGYADQVARLYTS